MVVGAGGDDIGPNRDQGSAYVFVRSGANWSEQAKLTASDGEGSDPLGSGPEFFGDTFGVSVAISGNTAVVGAYFDDIGANVAQGSAYIFVRDGTSWSEQAKLTASDGSESARFGRSVAVSGDTVVAGAEFAGSINQGSAYVFVRSGMSWSQQAQLVASDGSEFDSFGVSVAVSGDTALVGAPSDDGNDTNTNQGSAYVYRIAAPLPPVLVTSRFMTALSGQSTNPTAAPQGPAGVFSFTSRFCNTSAQGISGTFSRTSQLSAGKSLISRTRNAPAAPLGGVGSEQDFALDMGNADGTLSNGECVNVLYRIGLNTRTPFSFRVDLLGNVVP